MIKDAAEIGCLNGERSPARDVEIQDEPAGTTATPIPFFLYHPMVSKLSDDQPPPDLAAHTEETIAALRELHQAHRRAAPGLERLSTRVTGWLSRPSTLLAVTALLVVWVAANVGLVMAGRTAFDAP